MAAILLPFCGLRAAAPELHVFPTVQADAIGQKLQSAMVWADPSQNTPGVAVVFRKTFQLSAKPARADLHLFADARYVLWVNGKYVERGPNRFQPNGPEYDTINVAPFLKAGRNVIAVLVAGNLSGGKIMNHVPGLTAQLTADGKELFLTDTTWKWSADTRYRQFHANWPALIDKLVDARVDDGDWTAADYHDAAWKPAVAISGGAWGGLTARRIPLMREKEIPFKLANGATLPITLKAGEKLEFVTGKAVQVYPQIEMDAEKDSEVTLAPFDARYLAKAGPQKYFPLDSRGLVKGAISVKTGKVTITALKLIERLYPFDRLGSFRCSDPLLNKLWTMCARSCELLSEDAYVDCSERERVEWMDCDPPGFDITRIAMAGPGADGKPLYADPRLLEVMVRRTALTLQPEGWVKAHTCSDRYDIHAKMEDRACEWVAGIRRYYEATGDKALVREIWPAVVAQMNYFLERRTPRGLVSARDWVVWGNPLGYITGETTTLNVFVQRALADSAYLGSLIDEKPTAATFGKAAADLASAINLHLWDESTGSYFSGYFEDPNSPTALQEVGGKHVSKLKITDHHAPTTLHANVFALERGVVPPARCERVLKKMVEQDLAGGGSVMLYYYLARLLYGMDQPQQDTRVLNIFREKWASMAANPYECSCEGFGTGTNAHIYGMFPGYFLSAYVLGVRRDEPVAAGKILIEPHLGDLTQAEGTVVTEFGLVPVSWKREASGPLQFTMTVPAKVETVLALPLQGDRKEIQIDGRKVKGSVHGSRLLVTLLPGQHSGSY